MKLISRMWTILPSGETEFLRENEITTADILRLKESFLSRAEEEETMLELSVGQMGYFIETDAGGNLVAEWYDDVSYSLVRQTKTFDSVESLCGWLDTLMEG